MYMSSNYLHSEHETKHCDAKSNGINEPFVTVAYKFEGSNKFNVTDPDNNFNTLSFSLPSNPILLH